MMICARHSGVRRLACVLALAFATIASAALPARAHEGHDHGPGPSATAGAASPRVTAVSENYQLVGIVEGEVLVIYLDRFADNAPVTSAKLEVTIGDVAVQAELQKNGTYEVASPHLKSAGSHEILVAITDDVVTDLLVGSISDSPIWRPGREIGPFHLDALEGTYRGFAEAAGLGRRRHPRLVGPGATHQRRPPRRDSRRFDHRYSRHRIDRRLRRPGT